MSLGDLGKESSKAKPPIAVTTKTIGILALLLTAMFTKFLVSGGIAEATILIKKISGSGWDDARPELEKRYKALVKEGLSNITPQEEKDYIKCRTDLIIPWANQSGCSYHYNTLTTSKEEHTQDQEACLKDRNLEAKEAEFDSICGNKHLPADWKIFESVFYQTFLKAYKAKLSAGAPVNTNVPSCVVANYTKLLNSSMCVPYPEPSHTSCLDDLINNPKIGGHVDQIWLFCMK
jgi:hypothetical protein